MENLRLTLTVPQEERSPGLVAVGEDGKVIRKSVLTPEGLAIPLEGPARLELADRGKSFADVPAGSWAAEAAAFVSARQLFNGTSETAFSPNEPMTRAMAAVVLHNLENNPAHQATETFPDVPEGAWYAAAVAWANGEGIVTGYAGGTFGPGDRVTREQLAVMLWRCAGSPAPQGADLPFADAGEAGPYAREALLWAVERGILNGKGNGVLDPKGLATRAQAARMVMKFLES